MEWFKTGVCKLRPASRNRAASEGVRFFDRMRPVNVSHVFLRCSIKSMSQIERFEQNTNVKRIDQEGKLKPK